MSRGLGFGLFKNRLNAGLEESNFNVKTTLAVERHPQRAQLAFTPGELYNISRERRFDSDPARWLVVILNKYTLQNSILLILPLVLISTS